MKNHRESINTFVSDRVIYSCSCGKTSHDRRVIADHILEKQGVYLASDAINEPEIRALPQPLNAVEGLELISSGPTPQEMIYDLALALKSQKVEDQNADHIPRNTYYLDAFLDAYKGVKNGDN